MKEEKVQKRYDDEFKRQAVELVIHSGKSQAKIARELGVSEYSLILWKRSYLGQLKPGQLDGEPTGSRSGRTEDEEDDFVPWMEAPRPTTLGRLRTYLHECIHLRSKILPVAEGKQLLRFRGGGRIRSPTGFRG